ncbi:MAG: hypothetical protein J0M18_04165 [Ignavibacteria bacterium]|nr:hypothetical protein [Ignavibacteria bacterium]
MFYSISFLKRNLQANPFPYQNWYIVFDSLYDNEIKKLTREDVLYTLITLANIAVEMSIKSSVCFLRAVFDDEKDIIKILKSAGHNLSKLIDLLESDISKYNLHELFKSGENENYMDVIRRDLKILQDLNFVNMRYPEEKDLEKIIDYFKDTKNYQEQLLKIKNSVECVRYLRLHLEHHLLI